MEKENQQQKDPVTKEEFRKELRKEFDEMTPQEQKDLGEEMASVLRDTLLTQIAEQYDVIKGILEKDPEAAKKAIKKMSGN